MFNLYVVAMIDRVKTTDGDHALANNLQTRMQLMAWTLTLFEPIEAVRLSNLRRTGLACVNKFLANGWAQFDRRHNNLHTVMDRIVKKLDDDPHGYSYEPLNVISASKAVSDKGPKVKAKQEVSEPKAKV